MKNKMPCLNSWWPWIKNKVAKSRLRQRKQQLRTTLAQVQATNARLQQAVGKMASAKKAAKPQTTAPQGSADIAQGGIVDVGASATSASGKQAATPDEEPPQTTSSAIGSMARQIQGLNKSAPGIRPAPDIGKDASNDPPQQTQKRAAESRIKEHGGGIGPQQHWQDLMQETVTDVRPLWADVYRRLAPKIERHRDSFLAGQLYDELENIAELHGAEGEFKRMMNGARNRAHMEYDTNPGGFQNWFWFLPFEDEGINEGLLYSGDTWQDVLYRINVLNDIFGDQKDLAASFEPASQPEWGPFRDRILRSRTVLDTYAKVKQLANMNVPLTDTEIEMLADVAWDGGGGPVEPAGHWGERDYDWLEDLYAQQFAIVQHLLDQKAQGRGQNTIKSGQTVHEQGVAESTDDIKKRMSKLEALALAANRAGDDAKCKMYQQKIQSLKQKLSQSMTEGSKPGEYYIHTVYFKDGTKKRIRVTSDEFDVADYYTKRGKAVDHVDYDFQIHSDMTEGLKSTLAGAALAGAMALGGAGAAQAQSAAAGSSMPNATTIIQQIQAGKIQNQNDLSSALGDNQSIRQFVFKQLQAKAGLPGHGADSVINALAKKSTAGTQQPGAQQPVKSAGQSGVIVQRPTDNFEESNKRRRVIGRYPRYCVGHGCYSLLVDRWQFVRLRHSTSTDFCTTSVENWTGYWTYHTNSQKNHTCRHRS
jgi:hypothetical protein